ncbi:MAG: S1C family serine protease [Rubripirellula sp.]
MTLSLCLSAVVQGQQFIPDQGQFNQAIIQGQILEGQVIPGQVIQGQPVPGQIIQGQPIDGQVIVPGQYQGQPIPNGTIVPSTNGSIVPSTNGSRPVVRESLKQNSTGGTDVAVASELVRLLRRGGVPQSLDNLRKLEEQQRKVAKVAASCTVSVEIDPAQGCGVIITASGYVLTAAHVAMRPNKKAMITLSDGRRVRATTLGMDRSVDAGLIKIEGGQNNGRPWPHATLGTSEKLVRGMWCIATGHPGGYDQRRGTVTRIGRILDIRRGAIVTDCALIGGDSGGPLFDISGRLIAVHSRIGNDVSDNLHVPIDYYGDSWDEMQQGKAWGYLPGFRPVLGLKGRESSEKALVEQVSIGSPAEKAGIKPDDIIEQFGDVGISDFDSLKRAVADTMPGEHVRVWVNRDGNRIRLKVEVGRAD